MEKLKEIKVGQKVFFLTMLNGVSVIEYGEIVSVLPTLDYGMVMADCPHDFIIDAHELTCDHRSVERNGSYFCDNLRDLEDLCKQYSIEPKYGYSVISLFNPR